MNPEASASALTHPSIAADLLTRHARAAAADLLHLFKDTSLSFHLGHSTCRTIGILFLVSNTAHEWCSSLQQDALTLLGCT